MNIKKTLTFALGLVVVVMGLYLFFLVYISWPIEELSIRQAALLGDSFGIVNAFFSGLAFSGLIITIVLQRRELNESRKVFKSQKFEDAFYRLLGFYKENLNEITVHDNDDDSIYKGVGGLAHQIRKLSHAIGIYSKYQSGDKYNESNINELYVNIKKYLIPQARYIGTLESILYLIMSDIDDNRERDFYLNLLTSQLTVHEVKYIFYRCLISKTDSTLVRLVNDSKVIEQRVSESGINKKLIDLYNINHGSELKSYVNP
ncbi:putative phage abortive infection protein [Pectobacterium parmentieri]|uniref:putative phage abortive infection protein n=1 Tax=Pectobacterium parmentieri TaxID=1905730 RepID=UPI000675DF83|nr:putative phage abortive infection protein [Pectobacterium parmentieri]PWD57656.1 hypothetical protein DF211_20535 [Pectobacterium parmentieri]